MINLINHEVKTAARRLKSIALSAFYRTFIIM